MKTFTQVLIVMRGKVLQFLYLEENTYEEKQCGVGSIILQISSSEEFLCYRKILKKPTISQMYVQNAWCTPQHALSSRGVLVSCGHLVGSFKHSSPSEISVYFLISDTCGVIFKSQLQLCPSGMNALLSFYPFTK